MTDDDRHDMNHPMCPDCWDYRNPDRQPHRVLDDKTKKCCFCGRYTARGIYVRTHPNVVLTPYCTDLVTA